MNSIYLFILISMYGNRVNGYLEITVPDHKEIFDFDLYENVLDEELCQEQITYMQQNETQLLIEFLDAGIRTPRGVMTGNVLDLGNYFQCLRINRPITNSVVEGKYCMVYIPLNQDWPSLPSTQKWPDEWPDITWPKLNPSKFKINEEDMKHSRDYQSAIASYAAFNGAVNNKNRIAGSPLAALTFRLGTCIPKTCTPQMALKAMFNTTELASIDFQEDYCRLPNDKQWVAGDYIAFTIFGVCILLVILSTGYDIRCSVYQQKDPKEINKLLISFSAYTNTRRLVTYTPVPGALECLDGVRAFAMMWVIIGHTFANQIASQIVANPLDVLNWMTSLEAIWITAAPITVDTFFMLSGLLVVYTTAGKLTSMKLLKNLHLFYLNRLLRMFPALAAVILLHVSIFSRVADGPYWGMVTVLTQRCRVYWWSTLLHIQNYVNPSHMCLAHSWYLAIDVQLHILSPLVLVWVLTGKRRLAWSALIGAFIAIMTAATTYNFIKDFPAGPIIPSRPQDLMEYLDYYYVNTLTRGSPFFVGLIVGYLLHLNRGKKVTLHVILSSLLWICAIALAGLVLYSSYPIMQLNWDNQLADNMINSFARPAWAAVVGWLIFACVHGYGGPINWILSLPTWKVLSRLSYTMYLVHYPLMFVVNGMPIVPIYFDVKFTLFQFLAHFTLAVIVSYIITIVVDAPCSVLIKHFMGGGPKRPPKTIEPEPTVSGYIEITDPDPKDFFDYDLYESVLDEELCQEQIRYMLQNETQLLIEFLDAGIRTPRGVMTGNVIDLGNYFQCLHINRQITNSVVEGKYCMVSVPLNQNWPSLSPTPTWPDITLPEDWSDITWPKLSPRMFKMNEDDLKNLRDYQLAIKEFAAFNGARDNRIAGSPLADLTLRLGTCIPKPCTPRTVLQAMFNTTELATIEFQEDFCRLPNDRKWVAGDYVALSIFGVFILLVVLSTGYDIRYNVYQQKDPKEINKLLISFSAYTNTRRLVTYTPVPGALECLDGIRALAMMWVIIGHTFGIQIASPIMANHVDVFNYMTSIKGVWVTGAPITVDTFFMLSGLLLVYTTAGKLTSMKLLKNLHLFYLNRLLRMFPALAAVILLHVSIFSRVADGPYWETVAVHTQRCRVYWWSTLLHIQNYVNPSFTCIAPSWYLAIDVQLHILSPLVLVWVLTGKRRLAWSGLIGAFIGVMAAATTYNFIKNFQSATVSLSRPQDAAEYLQYYYLNTLTRASPFLVGLIVGYLLHLNRDKKVTLHIILSTLLWICFIVLIGLIMYSNYPTIQLNWDNQLADNMINSFMRAGWAVAVGWLIFACVHGYGGPVNWILSLSTWKVLSRLSFLMYLVHYPIMLIVYGMYVVPIYFDVKFGLFQFIAHFTLTVIVSYIITIVVDAPCTVLIKHFTGGGPKLRK
ncbi:hypothetical protein PYW08_002015 [Mythimna loreyi]|uniref:Uncharacterized protein n=1 Tax=Mythimna loreyi TaxID=667449 RepID=A0ACC2R0I5_9NEOP|nr:hypothetical protein PYW08_002015 [Mythimna loreyi]